MKIGSYLGNEYISVLLTEEDIGKILKTFVDMFQNSILNFKFLLYNKNIYKILLTFITNGRVSGRNIKLLQKIMLKQRSTAMT